MFKYFYSHSKYHLEKSDVRAGGMAQWLAARVLAEDPGSNSSIRRVGTGAQTGGTERQF